MNFLENNTNLSVWQNRYNIPSTSQEEQNEFESMIYDNKKRERACKRFINILNKYNIPEDLYTYGIKYPNNASYDYILALLMEDKIDEKRLHSSLCTLKQIKEEQESYLPKSRQAIANYMGKSAPTNINDYIKELQSTKTIAEEHSYNYKEGYTESQVMKAVLSGDKELLKEMEFSISTKEVPYIYIRRVLKRPYIYIRPS